MARYAIISDIHGNLPALEAVLGRIAELDVDQIVCLGDVVGYGPDPCSCIDLVTACCSLVVRGNHEDAVLDPRQSASMNDVARAAIEWTRSVIGPAHRSAIRRMHAMAELGDRVLCVHDCPAPAPSTYVHDQVVAGHAFRGVDRQICLVGHTHVPLVFETPARRVGEIVHPRDVIGYIAASGIGLELHPGHRYLCNPGAVGQPRDADSRASFAVLEFDPAATDGRDGDDHGARLDGLAPVRPNATFTVHRVEYDIVAAQAAAADAGLPTILGERLSLGA